MSSSTTWRICVCAALGLALGCGQSEKSSDEQGAANGEAQESGLPTLAIPSKGKPTPTPASSKVTAKLAKPADDDDDDDDDDADDEKTKVVAPKEGTPEALVHEATKLLLEPPPKSEDVAFLKKHRKEKNEKIVQLSQQAIKLTHANPEKERLFNLAVHNLMEARIQLAMAGDSDNVELLSADAAALFKRDPNSVAAAEAAHAQVNLAYGLAKNSSEDQTDWLQEFARLARRFAENFPKEERRSLPLLFAAGRSCELPGLTAEALNCYTVILKRFPNSPFAARVGPIVRRLKLAGKPPKLNGPTLNGEQISVDDLLGNVVVVVFWSSEAQPVLDQLPALQSVLRKQMRRGVQVVGVSLDLDPSLLQQFIVKNKISWPQVFFPDADQRGWANPIVTYYGVMDIPSLWLIDQSGNVISTQVKVESLAAEIDKLMTNGTEEESANAPADPPANVPKSERAAKAAAAPEAPEVRGESSSILERPRQRQAKKSPANDK